MESEDPHMIIGDDASLHEEHKERWYGSVKRISISEVNCNFVEWGIIISCEKMRINLHFNCNIICNLLHQIEKKLCCSGKKNGEF